MVDLSEDDQIQAAIKASLEEPRKSVTYISDSSEEENSDVDDVETFSDTEEDSQSSPVKNNSSKNSTNIAVCSNSQPSCSSKTVIAENKENNEDCKKYEKNNVENGFANSNSNSSCEEDSYKKYLGKESGMYFSFYRHMADILLIWRKTLTDQSIITFSCMYFLVLNGCSHVVGLLLRVFLEF